MQVSLKNSNGFVRFLLRHGEKLGIALLLAAAGMLFYSSLGRDRLTAEQLPGALETSADSARRHVEDMSWDTFPPEEVVPPATEFPVQAFSKPVPEDAFPQLPSYNGPVTPPVELRQDPILLALEDLEVSTGSGIWATADPDMLRQMRLQQMRNAAQEAAEAEAERERMEREAEEGRGRRRGGPEGPGGERGAYGMGGMGETTKSGAVIMRPSGGAQTQGFELIQSKSWVIVTAVVPLKKQFELYKDALENARGYSELDFPEYRGYQIERAEVTGEGPGEWKLLGNYYDKTLIREISQWPVQTPEVVNTKYVHPLLTFPLPPMVLRMWGEEVTHSSMPLPTPEELMYPDGMPEEELTAPATDEPADASDDPFASRRPRPGAGGYGGGEYGGRGGYGAEMGGYGAGRGGGYGAPGGGYGRGGEMGGYGGGRGGYGGEGGAMMGMGGGYGMSDAGDLELPKYVWDGKTKTLLFRFFDSSVQPGARYKYRVRLVITDPNADMPARYLTKDVSQRLDEEREQSRKKRAKGYRYTEWSEPSRTAVVPPPGLIYLSGASPASPSNYSSEPEAEIIVKTLNADVAAEAAIKAEFTRGSVINLTDYAKVIWSNAYQPEEGDEEPKFDFRTGVTLLDVAGGDKLPGTRDMTAPARALLMDSGGRLTIDDELDDYDTVREYNAIIEAAEDAKRNGGPGGGRGGGGYGRPGGF
ncbi:MAG: hypothetical protein KDA44_04620 [Planctomycetales bacterium]|nr:hypothetical protein [Planctomycetales bacterium]